MIVRLLLFAGAREAAGRGRDEFELDAGAPLEQLLADAVAPLRRPVRPGARHRRGSGSTATNPPRAGATELHAGDEIAVLPPVSGGSA